MLVWAGMHFTQFKSSKSQGFIWRCRVPLQLGITSPEEIHPPASDVPAWGRMSHPPSRSISLAIEGARQPGSVRHLHNRQLKLVKGNPTHGAQRESCTSEKCHTSPKHHSACWLGEGTIGVGVCLNSSSPWCSGKLGFFPVLPRI